MTPNHSLIDFFMNAGPVVKVVMAILLLASVVSWTFILQRWAFLVSMRARAKKFEQEFWSGVDLKQFYSVVKTDKDQFGMGSMFVAGFEEFMQLQQSQHANPSAGLDNIRRAMIAEENRITEVLEAHLPFLATVGSTSPYVGLFGTVWGIMTAFSALGAVQQATIAMVAPGISEALIATAMGLFAAIPAVIAYNRFTARVEHLLNRFDSFQEQFIQVLYHQLNRG